MKSKFFGVLICCASLALGGCDNISNKKIMEETKEPVMGFGDPITGGNFTGEAWLKMLSSEPGYDCNVYNVTFAPAVRNSWHSHTVGQILLCTEGIGYYQEKDKKARQLVVGDVINIPANTIHWHGAAPDSRFTHIGITPKVSENNTEWLGVVTDEEYYEATGDMVKKTETMKSEKKNIGSVLALYPTPATVVGTMVNGRVNWLVISHVGIIGHDRILISMSKSHYTNKGVIESGKLSVNIIDEALLADADYAGMVSGAKVDKSELFDFSLGDAGTPMIDKSLLTMECIVEHNYQTDTFDNFICTIANTYADESILNDKGKIDYTRLKPVLFEMPTYNYLRTGDIIGKCRTIGTKKG